MFVYSLSLLLSAQQICCMQPEHRPLKVDARNQIAIADTIKSLSTTNARLDKMQVFLGSVINNTELRRADLTTADFENIPLDDITINGKNLEQTQQLIITMQKEVARNNARRFPSWAAYTNARQNETRSKTLSTAVAGFVLKKMRFEPDLSIITGGGRSLPENPHDLDAVDIINALRIALGPVKETAIFLGKTIEDYKKELEAQHTFFIDTPCCYTPLGRSRQALSHKIDLRALAIPLVCFAQKQEFLKQTNEAYPPSYQNPGAGVGASIPAQPSDPNQTQQPPTYTEKPFPEAQFASPFVAGSANTGSINNNGNGK